jgi:hypothetical protein
MPMRVYLGTEVWKAWRCAGVCQHMDMASRGIGDMEGMKGIERYGKHGHVQACERVGT